jgi:hypothetical protein
MVVTIFYVHIFGAFLLALGYKSLLCSTIFFA